MQPLKPAKCLHPRFLQSELCVPNQHSQDWKQVKLWKFMWGLGRRLRPILLFGVWFRARSFKSLGCGLAGLIRFQTCLTRLSCCCCCCCCYIPRGSVCLKLVWSSSGFVWSATGQRLRLPVPEVSGVYGQGAVLELVDLVCALVLVVLPPDQLFQSVVDGISSIPDV